MGVPLNIQNELGKEYILELFMNPLRRRVFNIRDVPHTIREVRDEYKENTQKRKNV